VDENFTELKGEIAGPPDTPYEGSVTICFFHSLLYCCHVVDIKIVTYNLFSPTGGRYQLEIKIPETYPFNPPKVIFICDVFMIISYCGCKHVGWVLILPVRMVNSGSCIQ